ncbi:prolyl oligopeptidase family serine peptidase [Aridibaculum aurantiacum]|uniref:prolyl oligopeptidase family serine peptidase n=1 Tax=Aridibaculum aurantiacum TaxID=2810307 RepID=UPI001A9724BA|nr:prolyl oligopeptidase family serine peptidase [Aridibaculum aurantiacum]
MIRKFLTVVLVAVHVTVFAQQGGNVLTVQKIMRDPKWIGTSPSNTRWSWDGKILFFNWNPEGNMSDSVYYVTLNNLTPQKASVQMRRNTALDGDITYNNARTGFISTRGGDLYYTDVKSGRERRLTKTVDAESNVSFINNDSRIAFSRSQNMYAFDLATGFTEQLTNFVRGAAPAERRDNLNTQEKWLRDDQLREFEVLRQRKEKRDSAEAISKRMREKDLRSIYIDDRLMTSLTVSPDARFVTYRLTKRAANAKNTIVPNYVTETGYTEDIPSRTKVGAPGSTSEFFIFDVVADTVIKLQVDQLPGIKDAPDYAVADTSRKKAARGVTVYGPYWNNAGTHAVVDIRSDDNKDRWIMKLDAATAKLSLLDRQRDEAWVAGPGISPFAGGSNRWIDDNSYWYQSEATGYSHLYSINVVTGAKNQITSGNYEVKQVRLSNDRKSFYITTNQVHPGEQHFYKVNVNGGALQKLTTLTGAHDVRISPDEKNLAIRYSYSTKPWELYLQENKPGAKLVQVTNKAQSAEFASINWMDPQVVTFAARDGAQVYARLYKPANPHPTKPAVIFVHGAGYLQNAHKYWSTYFREYMFHNLLAQQGYTVLDIDYRGSEGYGRDWRTGIYRHMGGKDLSDHVDGAKYLVEQHGVDAKRIGIYGGSYGGFITLMAMFTEPGVFAAGAALRSVTDWAHYNHGYTSNILNEPFNDTLAYRKSSPIYYADGLQGALLMCHGMVDENVHFQDIVRLTQRLIELGKENWELAVYPVEDHGFVEPSSWTDEYRRILKLFETNLKK